MERTANCPSCRRGIFAHDAFCSWCGTRVQDPDTGTGEARRALATQTIPTAERMACGSCNGPILPGDVFCPTCGARHAIDASPGPDESSTSIAERVCEASGNKYQFVRELGRGGMGIVFVARDRDLGRLVAIKVLSPAWLTDDTMVERFRREARTIASLRHESIVTVYEEGRAGDLSYFAMDYIDGVSLSRILRTHGPLPIPLVEAVLYSVGTALAYAHRPGRAIVHRDIKPSNIMVDTEGHAVVMDFGISKASEKPSGLTSTGLVIGTPEYMSPEQCRGHTVTHESDQYSLGAVVYAMLTGAPPFTGPFYQVLMAHQTGAVPSLLAARPDCPPELAAATERMLAKHPAERWSNIGEAIRALQLRPLPAEDPVLQELGRLVRTTAVLTGTTGAAGEAVAAERTQRTPTSIRILPHPQELEVGDELNLTATMLYEDGIEEAGHQISWQSTDPGIARVDPSTGRLVAVGTGSAVITAVGDGLEEAVAVQVNRPQVVEIAIVPGDVELAIGDTVQLRAEPRNKRGETMQGVIAWSSSDPRTATVSDAGVVTARRSGRVTVLAHGEGVGGSTVIRVVSRSGDAATAGETPVRAVARVLLSAPPGELKMTDTFRLTGTPVDTAGQPLERPVRGAVLEPGVLEHLGSGRFRVVDAGEAVIEAEADGVRTRLRIPVAAVAAGLSRTFVAGAEPAGESATVWLGRTTRALFASRYSWIAIVLVAAAGGVWSIVQSMGGPEQPLPVADIAVRTAAGPVGADGLQLIAGDTVRFTAVLSAGDGTPLDRLTVWNSDDPAVAFIDSAGMLVALARGNATVSVSSEAIDLNIPITVDAAGVDLALRTRSDGQPVSGPLRLEAGDYIELEAVVTDGVGNELPGETVRWASSAPLIAGVDATGRVSGQSGGNATITATSGSGALNRTVDVSVSESRPPPTGTLTFRISPWARIWIDGVQRAERASQYSVSLSPGSHDIQLWIQGRTQFDTTVVVAPGGSYTIRK
jgi:serine/threonine protein kinase